LSVVFIIINFCDDFPLLQLVFWASDLFVPLASAIWFRGLKFAAEVKVEGEKAEKAVVLNGQF
jgi:hypothetical protein